MSVLAVVGGMAAAFAPVAGAVAWIMNRRKRVADTTKVEVDANKTIAEIIQVHAAARNLDANTLKEITAVYQGVIDELRKELGDLNGRMDKMEEELQEAQKELRSAREGLIARDNKIGEMQRHITKLEEQLKGKEDKV